MDRISPASYFDIVTPDEVAECWDGVLAEDGLYQALWDCVPHYKAPSPEESEEPCYGMDCVADFWDRFSKDHKEALNRLAEAKEADYAEGDVTEAMEWHDFDPDC